MRKEIPLLITGLVGIVLILQYFSPNKTISGIEDIFTKWMQIIAAFSMILGVLNLIRVNGDKIYKKRKNWGFSIVILVSLFATLIVGFANIGSESMYDRKMLKTNSAVIGNIAKDVMKQNGIKQDDKLYGDILTSLVNATQKEKTISSILPQSLKQGDIRAKFDKMLAEVKARSEKSIKLINGIGRQINMDLEKTLEKLNSEKFGKNILRVYDDMLNEVYGVNKSFKLENKKIIADNIYSQVGYLLLNYENINTEYPYYKEFKTFVNEFNDFIEKDEKINAKLKENIASSKTYEEFYKKSAPLFALKKNDEYYNFLLSNLLHTYLNNIYTYKTTDIAQKVKKSLAENKDFAIALTSFVKNKLKEKYKGRFKEYFKNSSEYLAKNTYVKSDSVIKQFYDMVVNNLIIIPREGIEKLISSNAKNPDLKKKLRTDKKLLASVINENQEKVKKLGLSEKSSKFVMQKLLETGSEYKLATLEVGSSFMEIYRYIFTPLSSTMFALLAFFVASASYRAFRARNKEATLLLVSGFLVMLGAVPIGEVLTIKGIFSVSEVSDFILNVPVMSVQSGIMIGVALGVISTSLRLILGIERSHLGGD